MRVRNIYIWKTYIRHGRLWLRFRYMNHRPVSERATAFTI